mmetsp:Transcript_5208/g.5942  ORF Transcript_5208/g.5942 Transcript_5208/m.5942 type:complete len:497 (+) Transcript_5208:289-1779(+)
MESTMRVTLLLLSLFVIDSSTTDPSFQIIIDGGSTGSRLHVYQTHTSNSKPSTIERIGTQKSSIPFSSVCNDQQPCTPQRVSESLRPLLKYASTVIDPAYHATTSVHYQATAGMRLLSLEQQTHMYDMLYQGLLDFPFVLDRRDLGTLDGASEGYYGLIAANYLAGSIGLGLGLKRPGGGNNGTVGALDMGGSSTQISYPTSKSGRLSSPEDVVAVSFLGFGVETFRERVWNFWIASSHQNIHHSNHTAASIFNHNNHTAAPISNPCALRGHRTTYRSHTLVGTGNATECQTQINRILVNNEDGGDALALPSPPPAHGKRFLGMSVFFFALDALRVLGQNEALERHWPRPTLVELEDALPSLCGLEWNDGLHLQHQYTSGNGMPHRCFEAVYLVNLLRVAYGLDPRERSVTYLYDVEGQEVEWTLGMAVLLHQGVPKQQQIHHGGEKVCENDDCGIEEKWDRVCYDNTSSSKDDDFLEDVTNDAHYTSPPAYIESM